MDEDPANEDQAQSPAPQTPAGSDTIFRYHSCGPKAGSANNYNTTSANESPRQITTHASRSQASSDPPNSLGHSTGCCDPTSGRPSLTDNICAGPTFCAAKATISASATHTIPSFYSSGTQSTFVQCRLPAAAADARHTRPRHTSRDHALTIADNLSNDRNPASFHYSDAIQKGY